MRDLLRHLNILSEPKEFLGLRKYYSTHGVMPWKSHESDNYVIDVNPPDIYSGSLIVPTKPHVFVIDELKVGQRSFANLIAIDAHGHVRDGDWTAKNGSSHVDIVDLVKELYDHGHNINLLLMCAQYDYFGSEQTNDPPPQYYSFLNEHGIIYSRPSSTVVPVLKMDHNGRTSGYLYDTGEFENIDQTQK